MVDVAKTAYRNNDASASVGLWVVYMNPRDYPGKFVVRGWKQSPGGSMHPNQLPSAVSSSLKQARSLVGLSKATHTRFDRHPTDDPAILEVWVPGRMCYRLVLLPLNENGRRVWRTQTIHQP